MQEAGDGGIGFSQGLRGFGERAALQMVQDDGLALWLGQLCQRISEAKEILVAHRLLARRRQGRR
jgi:hypothetical protein